MSTVYVDAGPEAPEVLSLVRAAVEGEARRLELALGAARRRLARFFGMSVDFRMYLQLRWDLYHAQRAEQDELTSILPHAAVGNQAG